MSIWSWDNRLLRFRKSFFIIILVFKSVVSKIKFSRPFCLFNFYLFIFYFWFRIWFFEISILLWRFLMSWIFNYNLYWLSLILKILFFSVLLSFKLFLFQFSDFLKFLSSFICESAIYCIWYESFLLIWVSFVFNSYLFIFNLLLFLNNFIFFCFL